MEVMLQVLPVGRRHEVRLLETRILLIFWQPPSTSIFSARLIACQCMGTILFQRILFFYLCSLRCGADFTSLYGPSVCGS